MSIFLKLLKINLITSFTSGSFYNAAKKSKKQKIVYNFLTGFLVVFMLAYMGVFGFFLGDALHKANAINILMVISFLMGSILIFINAFYSSINFVFKCKDLDFLSSLPINKNVIYFSKLSSLIIACWGLSLFIVLPFSVVYFYFAGFKILEFIYIFFGILLLPLFPVFLSMILSLGFSVITQRMRYKQFFYIIFMLAFLIFIMYFSFNMQEALVNIVDQPNSIIKTANLIFLPGTFISAAIFTGSFTQFLLYCSVCILPFLLLNLILAKNHLRINSYLNKSSKKIKKEYSAKQSGTIFTLIKKEFLLLFNSTIYFLNSCVGPILLLIGAIALLFNRDFLLQLEMGDMEPILIIITMIGFLCYMPGPLTVNISIDAKQFWITKIIPISAEKIILSKLLFQLILFLPLVLISCAFSSIALSLGLFEVLLLFSFGIGACLLSALQSLSLDIKRYNFRWTSEIILVKQSANVLIQVFVGMLIASLPPILYYSLLSSIFTVNIFSLIVVISTFLSVLGYIVWMKNKGVKLFKSIN